MIDPNADREALREELRFLVIEAHPGESWTDAILDADDLLITDLGCPTCWGEGYVVEMPDPAAMPCDTCAGTGVLDKKVVDADLLRRMAVRLSEDGLTLLDAEAWDLLVALLRACHERNKATSEWDETEPATRALALISAAARDAAQADQTLLLAAALDRLHAAGLALAPSWIFVWIALRLKALDDEGVQPGYPADSKRTEWK